MKMNAETVRNLLNNNVLLRFVRKYSADNIQADSKIADQFNVKTNEDSITIGDSTMTKAIITQARYAGKEHARYNLKQIREVFDFVGNEGEMIVSADANKVLAVQVKDSVVLVSALPEADKKGE